MPITLSNVFYIYNENSPLEQKALNDVSLSIKEGSFTALVGRTGSGKSTLVQHLNFLLTPSHGKVEVEGYTNSPIKKERSKNLYKVRKHIGLVFQFPEYQLFEETVEKDVMFAPINFGSSKEEAAFKAHQALSEVGLDSSFYNRSPFELSGGEKRRVAIAGILAFEPKILVIDEPTAGLDPNGAKEMMALFEKIHQKGTTVILVTHDMNLVLKYADRVIVLNEGKIVKDDVPAKLFEGEIEEYSLETPLLFVLVKALRKKGWNLDLSKINDIPSLVSQIKKAKEEKE